jgi:hypothetical protein
MAGSVPFRRTTATGWRMPVEQGLEPDNGLGKVVWDAYRSHVGSPVEMALRQVME